MENGEENWLCFQYLFFIFNNNFCSVVYYDWLWEWRLQNAVWDLDFWQFVIVFIFFTKAEHAQCRPLLMAGVSNNEIPAIIWLPRAGRGNMMNYSTHFKLELSFLPFSYFYWCWQDCWAWGWFTDAELIYKILELSNCCSKAWLSLQSSIPIACV